MHGIFPVNDLSPIYTQLHLLRKDPNLLHIPNADSHFGKVTLSLSSQLKFAMLATIFNSSVTKHTITIFLTISNGIEPHIERFEMQTIQL